MTSPAHGLILDIFAGGGGASSGIRSALGKEPNVALNHCAAALAMHRANHPSTLHYEHDVTLANPRALTQGQPVKLIWFSPDCTNHSNAKGGKPLDRKSRMLAEEIPRWLEELRPELGVMENVVEFLDYGPLHEDGPLKDRPIKERKGEFFRNLIAKCAGLGYRAEWKRISADTLGAPTRRMRLFVIFKRTRGPIVWPSPTHGPGLLPYRTAGEFIDWSIPCPSIFGRGLVDATMERLRVGTMRLVVNNPNRYLKRVGWGPARDNSNLVAAFLTQHNGGYNETPGHPLDRPISTIMGKGSHQQLVASHLVKLRHYSSGTDLNEPLHTISAGGQHHGLVAAFLDKYYKTGTAAPMDQPMPTGTTKDRFSLVVVSIDGEDHVLTDICMRMLVPRELASCMGFEPNYILDPIFRGKPLTKTAQVKCIGNSVCPQVAEAIIRVNVCLDTPYQVPSWSGFRRLPALAVGQGNLW